MLSLLSLMSSPSWVENEDGYRTATQFDPETGFTIQSSIPTSWKREKVSRWCLTVRQDEGAFPASGVTAFQSGLAASLDVVKLPASAADWDWANADLITDGGEEGRRMDAKAHQDVASRMKTAGCHGLVVLRPIALMVGEPPSQWLVDFATTTSFKARRSVRVSTVPVMDSNWDWRQIGERVARAWSSLNQQKPAVDAVGPTLTPVSTTPMPNQPVVGAMSCPTGSATCRSSTETGLVTTTGHTMSVWRATYGEELDSSQAADVIHELPFTPTQVGVFNWGDNGTYLWAYGAGTFLWLDNANKPHTIQLPKTSRVFSASSDWMVVVTANGGSTDVRTFHPGDDFSPTYTGPTLTWPVLDLWPVGAPDNGKWVARDGKQWVRFQASVVPK